MTEPHGPRVKNPYVGNIRWAFMRWADIESAFFPGYVYLRRLRILQTPWFALYLHFIYEADLDRDPHDHPCNFWSLILRGGYTERVYMNSANLFYNEHRTRRLFSIAKMPLDWAHRIVELKPHTTTLCLFGPRRKRWGFWTDLGVVDFEQYDRTADPYVA
jgi:hypothetical protein